MRDKQRLCFNSTNGSAKISYRSVAAARKIQKLSRDGGLSIYGPCRFCAGYHLSSQEQRCKVIAPPSAAKLRRKLTEAGRQIAACERSLRKADERLAAERSRIETQRQEAELVHRDELAALNALVERLQWTR